LVESVDSDQKQIDSSIESIEFEQKQKIPPVCFIDRLNSDNIIEKQQKQKQKFDNIYIYIQQNRNRRIRQ